MAHSTSAVCHPPSILQYAYRFSEGKASTAFALEQTYEATGRALKGVALGLSRDHEGAGILVIQMG